MSERVRLLHVITSLYRAGAENHLLALTKAMDRDRFDISVAYMQPYHDLVPDFQKLGIPTYPLNTRRWLAPKSLFQLGQLLRSGNYDIVHSHLYPADVYTFAALPLRRSPVWLSSWHNEPPSLHSPIHQFSSRLMYKRQRGAIAISKSVSHYYHRMCGLDGRKTHIIPYGIDFDESLKVIGHRTREKIGLTADDFVLAMVARLVPQKNHKIALYALDRLRDEAPKVKLLIIGEGKLDGQLRAMVADLQLTDRVFFLGFQKDVHSLLALVDVLLLCSEYEGFGLVILEAMCHRKGIIASHVGPIPEIVLDGETGILFPPSDATALADAILALRNNRAKLMDMGERGFQRLQVYFSAARMAAETEALYLQLLA